MVVFKHKNVLHKQTLQCLLSLGTCTSSSSCSTNAARCVSTFFFLSSPLSLLLLCSCMLHQQRQCGSFLAVQVMAPYTPTRTNAVLATTGPLCTCPATSSTTNATITVLTLQQPHLEASWCLCCCCLLLMTKKHAAASQFVPVSQSVVQWQRRGGCVWGACYVLQHFAQCTPGRRSFASSVPLQQWCQSPGTGPSVPQCPPHRLVLCSRRCSS